MPKIVQQVAPVPKEDILKAQKLRALVKGMAGQELTVPRYLDRIFRMYWRGTGLYSGCIRLIANRHGEESMFLARALFEESLLLAELAGLPLPERKALAVRIDLDSNDRTERVFQLHRDLGLSKKDRDFEAGFAKRRNALTAYCRTEQIEPAQPEKDPTKKRALRLDLKEEYWLYEFCHQMVHGNDLALELRSTKIDGKNGIMDTTQEVEIIQACLAFASRSVIRQYIAGCALFGWTQAPMDEFEAFFRDK